ncbi:MAG: hypothetical protein GY694_20050 [Gammaproteobacteria bacterium]|nr:hypothetical protein [Gammaproteobacteria bacterium]
MEKSSEYEFSPEENATVNGLISSMVRTGIVLLLMGLVFAAYQLIHYFDFESSAVSTEVSSKIAILNLIDYLIWLMLGINGGILGVLCIRATAGFKMVVRTKGNDIEHLISGLKSLTAIFKLAFLVLLISVIALIVSTILMIAVF